MRSGKAGEQQIVASLPIIGGLSPMQAENADGSRPGLSAAKFELGVVYEEDKSSGAADIDAARKAIARITYATRIGALILREAGGVLPAGEYTFLPDDDNAIPDAIIPD